MESAGSREDKRNQQRRTIAPGHPPIVNITMSHIVSSSVFGVESSSAALTDRISSILGRNTLNIVYANRP